MSWPVLVVCRSPLVMFGVAQHGSNSSFLKVSYEGRRDLFVIRLWIIFGVYTIGLKWSLSAEISYQADASGRLPLEYIWGCTTVWLTFALSLEMLYP